MKICIVRAGAWGIALARMLCNFGHTVTVWSALPEEIAQLKKTRIQKNLPNMEIPDEIVFTTDLKRVCEDEILLFAVLSVLFVQHLN